MKLFTLHTHFCFLPLAFKDLIFQKLVLLGEGVTSQLTILLFPVLSFVLKEPTTLKIIFFHKILSEKKEWHRKIYAWSGYIYLTVMRLHLKSRHVILTKETTSSVYLTIYLTGVTYIFLVVLLNMRFVL